MRRKWPWTLCLCLMVVIDSLWTIYLGVEENPLILWLMNMSGWSLEMTMYVRIFYYIPLIWMVHKYDYVRLCVMAYAGIYIINAVIAYGLYCKIPT